MTQRPQRVGLSNSIGLLLSDLSCLFKLRLNSMTIAAAGIAYHVAAGGNPSWPTMAAFLVGLYAAASGASGLNQVLESDTDGLMPRTAARPLPCYRLRRRDVAVLSILLAGAGLTQVMIAANVLAAALALATLLIYVLVYTPLKRRTPLHTLVGGVSGALLPVVGWAAASNSIGYGAGALFALLFVWQLIHLPAIAWMYRGQYSAAGIRMLSTVDASGGLTARLILLSTLILVPTSLLPAAGGALSPLQVVGTLLLDAAMATAALAFAARRSTQRARVIFIGSLIYLPLMLVLMVV